MRQLLFCLTIALLLQGCSPPSTVVRSVDSRPTISIVGAHDSADLVVDGIRVGKAVDFAEPNQLRLDAGTHRIAIVEGGRAVFEQTIFIESEHKTITVR